MPIDNNVQSNSPRWLQDTVSTLDKLNTQLTQVQSAIQGVSQTTLPGDRFQATSTAPASTGSSVRFTMDNQGNLHTKALGLIDFSLDPDELLNGEYTKQVSLQPQGKSTNLQAEYSLLGFIKVPLNANCDFEMKSVKSFAIDFRGQKILDVNANLSFLGISLPFRVRVQAQRLGAGQYRFHFSDALMGKKDTRIPKFITAFCFWLAAKTNGMGGTKLAGSAIDVNIPQTLSSLGMYGN
ncbi:MAG TPA: hypothetical protein V6C82_06800 [Chroococcales cyanobacterium]